MMIFLAVLTVGFVYEWKKAHSNGTNMTIQDQTIDQDEYFKGLSGELSDKGFLVTSVDELRINWARTGSLMWMTFPTRLLCG